MTALMRQIQIGEWTTPDRLAVDTGPVPDCGPGQVRIRVKATAITHSLLLLISGQYQRRPDLPFVPGSFAAGEIVAVGEGATRFALGDRVIASLETGGLAEEAVAWESCTYAIPPSLPFDRANALNASYSSVLAALTWPRLLDVEEGDRLLVTGATGATGLAAVELGRALGATVIGAVRDDSRRPVVLDHGAHHTVTSDPELMRDEVLALTDGMGVDAVVDPVGGEVFRQALRCVAPGGRMVPLGFASGSIPQIPANLLLVKNVSVCGLNMGFYKLVQRVKYESRIRAMFSQLGSWFEQGVIRPELAATFPLERVGDAFEAIRERQRVGHVAVVFE